MSAWELIPLFQSRCVGLALCMHEWLQACSARTGDQPIMSLMGSRCSLLNFDRRSETPPPSHQGQRFTPKQTIPLSVLRNSTYRLLCVLSQSKNVLVHTVKAYGGDGIAPLILSLDTRSVQDHAPNRFIPPRNLWCTVNMWLGGPRSQFRYYGQNISCLQA
jgi:hypothetical protein